MPHNTIYIATLASNRLLNRYRSILEYIKFKAINYTENKTIPKKYPHEIPTVIQLYNNDIDPAIKPQYKPNNIGTIAISKNTKYKKILWENLIGYLRAFTRS